MAIKLEPTYTEAEVSRILRDSEGQVVEGEHPASEGGHAESRHELIARGRRREHVTIAGMRGRIVTDDDPKEQVGAFQNCQAKAIALALNSKAGQTALSWLCIEACFHVFARIDISTGVFRMIGLHEDVLVPPPSGTTTFVGPVGLPMARIMVAGGIAMKLMKAPGKTLHIRTAFPLIAAPAPPRAKITWRTGGSLQQDLPI